MIKFNAVCSGSVASTLGLKHAHERLTQMVSSGDCSGPLKRSARLTYEAKKVASKKAGGLVKYAPCLCSSRDPLLQNLRLIYFRHPANHAFHMLHMKHNNELCFRRG